MMMFITIFAKARRKRGSRNKKSNFVSMSRED